MKPKIPALIAAMLLLPNCAFGNWTRYIYDESGNIIQRVKLRFGPSLSMKANMLEDIEVTASPNPTDGIFYVRVPEGNEQTGLITLLNNSGAVLACKELADEVSFDLSGFAKGIYYVVVETEDGYKTLKIIKE